MNDDTAQNLATNMRQLREARSLTQAQMAERANLPRPTWANLETGTANPTLTVLIKVARALSVSLEELLGPPRPSSKFYAATDLLVRRRGKVSVRELLPEGLAGLQLERLELPPGASMAGIPHTPGTREYLTCERGPLQLTESGTTWTLEAGDVVVFRGDQKHGYKNPGGDTAVAYSVIALAPA